MNIPLEDFEAEMLVNYLRSCNYEFAHIWNESGQRWTKNIIAMMNKKKKLWVAKWFPDYCIVLKRWSILFIELKRQRRVLQNWNLWASPSKTSEEQKKWIKILNLIDNISAEICYWADEAINQIHYFENL